ncbi:MAG: hypothetical protein AB7P14_02000 [Blastocatellales bacterium]
MEKLTEPKFKRRLVAHFFVRFHMTLILSAVCFSGVITSKLLLVLGLRSIAVRYVIAITCAYLLFFLLVRLWLWYIGISPRARNLVNQSHNRQSSTTSVADVLSFDVSPGIGGSGSSPVGFGGGSSGGAGASDSWDSPLPGNWLTSNQTMPSSNSSAFNLGSSSGSLGGNSGGSSGGNWFDLDLGDDGCGAIILLLLLIALVFGVFGAGFYLIYQAPAIFAEAAFQAALASGLIKASNKIDAADWRGSVFKATWIPFVIVMILALAFGIAAHRYCPAATKVTEVFSNCK